MLRRFRIPLLRSSSSDDADDADDSDANKETDGD